MIEAIWNFFTANIGTKLISVVIAIVLWAIVLGSRNVEVTKDIPLEVITPTDILPANEIPDRISFRLSGPKAFLRAVLDRREDPIRVNLAGAKPGLVTYRFFSDNIRLPIGVKVLSINPTAILIKLEYLKHRDVPVRLELRGLPPEGYRISRTEVKPPVVRIRGAESRVDSMAEVATTPIDLTGIRQSIDREVPLDLSRYNIQLDGPLPRAIVEIEPVAANYRIKNVDVRVLSSLHVKLDEKTVTVLVRVSPNELKLLDRSHVYAIVDMSGKGRGTYREHVTVQLPPDVGLVKVIPDQVNVTLY